MEHIALQRRSTRLQILPCESKHNLLEGGNLWVEQHLWRKNNCQHFAQDPELKLKAAHDICANLNSTSVCMLSMSLHSLLAHVYA